MSSNSPLPSQFQAIFNAALKEYSKKTGKDIVTDPITAKLRFCRSPDEMLNSLRNEAQAFNDFRSGNRTVQLMRKLKPIVEILHALSACSVLGNGIGSPASAILAGIGLLLAAARGVSTSYDSLIDLFECFENYLSRLRILSEIPPASMGILVKIMVELLGVLALATQQIKQGRLKKFAKKLLGENDVEAVLQRLDRLTMEESRMTIAETMEVVHGLFANMTEVMDDGKTSTNNIREALVAIQGIAEGVNKMKRGKLQNSIRQWLSPPNPSINHNIASGVHHKVTATWFTSGAVYTGWKVLGSLLWAHGKPGSGKSVFCSSIIKDLEDSQKAGLASLAYYYFDFKDSQKQDRRGLLSSLVLQLSARSDAFSGILAQMHLTHDEGSRQPSESDLIDCLKEMLTDHGQGKIYIILDALDECPNNSGMPTSREKVLNLLKDIISLRLPHVHICVTSRPEVDIQTALDHLASHRVSLHEEGGQRQDIIDYLKSVVESDPKMGKWREEDKQLVINTLARKADGMFRWVFCQLDTLRRCFPGSIRRALNEIPRTLDETYERILLGIDEEKWEYAHRLFQCLTVSCRPLLVEELAEVLALDLDTGTIPELNVNLRPKDAEEAVLSACSTMISIIKSDSETVPVVQFSHYSVKEFLTSGRLESSRSILSRFYIFPWSAHQIFAQSCISTLLLLKGDHLDAIDFPLVRYAAQYWVDHAQVHGVASHIQIGMESLFDPEEPHFVRWLDFRRQLFRDLPGEPRSPLSCAARYGFDHLVKHLVITKRLILNAPDPEAVTPLQAAARGGNHAIVQFLLERGADANRRGHRNRTPLHEAAMKGHRDVTQLLLNGGGDTRAIDDLGTSPLHEALDYGNLNVLQLLLEQGADVNTRDGMDSTPLHGASESGSIDAVKLLLNYSADTRALNDQGDSPLHTALEWGNLDVLQLLLERGANVNTRDDRNSTPLHDASESGSINAVKLLLNYGADTRALDDQGDSPLHKALECGNLNVLQLLLERGADVNTRDDRDSTPLHKASESGSIDAVQLLLKYGADMEARDNQGDSSLHKASRYGEIGVVHLLLKNGIEVNGADSSGSTPLHQASISSPLHEASCSGNVQIVRLLLQYGADVNTRDSEGSTPLHRALICGHFDVGRQLLDFGANIMVNGNQGTTSLLHTASLYGHAHVVQQLLQYHVDVNIRDDEGSTPLHIASRSGHVEIVENLLRWGAHVDARNHDYKTALCEASLHGHTKVVEALLEGEVDANARKSGYQTSLHVPAETRNFNLGYGADPNAQDKCGWTPLHFAATGRHLQIVNLLSDHGANVHSQEEHRRTPLHLAAFIGDGDTARCLIEHGANLHSRDDHGRTPFSVALETGNRKVARLLSDWESS